MADARSVSKPIASIIVEDTAKKEIEIKSELVSRLGFTRDVKARGADESAREIAKRGGAISDVKVDGKTGATTYAVISPEGKPIGVGYAWKDERGEMHMLQFYQEAE